MRAALMEKAEDYLRATTAPVDTAPFNDALAERVDWFVLGFDGKTHRTHHLVTVAPERVEFRPSAGSRFRTVVAALFALGLLFLVVVGLVDSDDPASFDFFPVVLGLFVLFGIPVVFWAAKARQAMVFDRGHNACWKGVVRAGMSPQASKIKDLTPFQDIHALQLLMETLPGEDGDAHAFYDRYELNLVLRDGGRIHVTGHNDGDRLRADVEKLSALLRAPTWDATTNPPRLIPPSTAIRYDIDGERSSR